MKEKKKEREKIKLIGNRKLEKQIIKIQQILFLKRTSK